LNNHLLSKHLFLISRTSIPRPPWSLGRQMMFHLVGLYFLYVDHFARRNETDKNLMFYEPF
jgi:hypothetical protein